MVSAKLARPLVVSLDALLRTDLAYERRLSMLAAHLGAPVSLDIATLPYDAHVLEIMDDARAAGQKLYLATVQAHADVLAIAAHLGISDKIIVASHKLAQRLVEKFGERGFDYIGSNAADLPVWAMANKAYGVRLAPSVRANLVALSPDAQANAAPPHRWRIWLKALRVHQYTKNFLLFVPMLMAHHVDVETLRDAVLGFIAFSACASSVYILNDLVDLSGDRAHPRKRRRPFASGDLPVAAALPLAAALLAGGLMLASLLPVRFLLCLIGYLILTTAYTFWLKRQMVIDVVVLALLYTTRILAGGYATDVIVSEWLLALSTFIFTALALMKRYVELVALLEHNLQDPKNRDYKRSDLPVIAALAAASAMNSVTIFALYLSSATVVSAYSRPRALWLMCPLLLYWLARALMMAHRGTMDDDPVVFALRDRTSWLTLACMACVFLLAL